MCVYIDLYNVHACMHAYIQHTSVIFRCAIEFTRKKPSVGPFDKVEHQELWPINKGPTFSEVSCSRSGRAPDSGDTPGSGEDSCVNTRSVSRT